MKQKIIDRLMFFKSNWRSFVAFITLTFLMTLGLLTLYATVWITVGLPSSDVAMFVLSILALVSEWLFIRWVAKW